MNLIIFCVIFCFPTTLAFQVSFYYSESLMFDGKTLPQVYCKPHQFMYQRDDYLTLQILVMNYTSTVTEAALLNVEYLNKAVAVIKTRSGISRIMYEPGKEIWIKWKLKTETIIIDLELLTTDETCLRVTILKGSEMPANATDTRDMYNNICIKGNQCAVEVNVAVECKGSGMKPQPCAVTDDTKSLVSTALPATDTSNFLNRPQNILNATDNSKGAETSYFTVMIITSIIAAVSLISLLVIALWHGCRKTRNPPGLPQMLPVNANRYYENVVFRDGLQHDGEQLEQRASTHHYEEINNY